MSIRMGLPSAWIAAATFLAASTSALGGHDTLGKWEPVVEINADPSWPLAMHAVHLPSGLVLVWYEDPNDQSRPAKTWDPVSHQILNAATPLAKGRSGHAAIPDGSVVVAGGEIDGLSTNLAARFDGSVWTDIADLALDHWRPTCTSLANGKLLVTAGTTTLDDCATVPLTHEIFDPATGQWTSLTPIMPVSAPPPPPPCVNPFFICVSPWMFVMPTGNLFYAGGTQDLSTWQLRLDVTPPIWECVDESNFVGSKFGSAVIYQRDPANPFGPPGPMEVLKCGGNVTIPGFIEDEPSELVERINLSVAPSQWEIVSFMFNPRIEHNTVLLPNNKVLVVGGMNSDAPACFDAGGCAVGWAEWIDPNDPDGFPNWELLAQTITDRGHHSTAVLLLDGSVLVAGGEGPSAYTAEIFKPPYLFSGGDELTDEQRPRISSAPAVITYGRPFAVRLEPNPPLPYMKVTLVRLGATTHAFDQNQRLLSLTYIVQGDPTAPVLTVTPPASPNLAPPGYYMLFVVTGNTPLGGGIPSKGRYVQLR